MMLSVAALTLAGSMVFGLLLGTEALFPQLWSCRWRYWARLAILPVFLVPFTIPAALLPRPQSMLFTHWSTTAPVLQNSGTLAAAPASGLATAIPTLVAIVWAVGIALFLAWRLIAWARFCGVVRRSCTPAGSCEQALLAQCAKALGIRRCARLMICTGIGTPMLMGITRPVILLPHSGIPTNELEAILRHELIHLRRFDTTRKLAAQLVNAVHWFNPAAWLLAGQIGELCELACDEAAVHGMSKAQRRQYGFAILNQIACAQRELPQAVSAFASTKQILQKRLEVIMNMPKINKKRTLIATAAGAVLCAACITTAFAFAPADISPSVIISSAADELLVSFECPIPDTAAYRQISLAFGGSTNHTAIDIVSPNGTAVLTAADGTVVYASSNSAYGNHLIVEHDGNFKTLYAHCDELLVSAGDTVRQGDTIATVGSTGWSTGPHLHFEVRKGIDPVDPEQYVEITNTTPAK